MWETATSHALASFTGDGELSMHAGTFSYDGSRLATMTTGGELQVWDVAQGRQVTAIRTSGGGVCLALSPDGTRVAIGGDSIGPREYDVATGSQVACYSPTRGDLLDPPLTEIPLCMAYSPDGALLASGTDEGKINISDTKSKKLQIVVQCDAGAMTDIVFSPDCQWIVGSTHRSIHRWDLKPSRGRRQQIARRDDAKGMVALSPGGTKLLTKAKGYGLRIVDTLSGKPLSRLQEFAALVWDTAFSPDGRFVAAVLSSLRSSADTDSEETRALVVWDTQSGKAVLQTSFRVKYRAACLFSPDGRIVAAASDEEMRLYETKQWRGTTVLPGTKCAAFSPDGSRIAGWGNKLLNIWDTATGMQLLSVPSPILVSLCFSPDGSRLVGGVLGMYGDDQTVRVWDAVTGAELRILRGHRGRVDHVSWSADGSYIAAQADTALFQLVQADTGQVLAELEGTGERALETYRQAAESGGQASVRQTSEIFQRVWQSETGACVEVIRGEGDTEAIAAGSTRFPFRAVGRGNETVIESVKTGQPLGWYSDRLRDISTHPDGRIWLGQVNLPSIVGATNRATLFQLEGRDPRQ